MSKDDNDLNKNLNSAEQNEDEDYLDEENEDWVLDNLDDDDLFDDDDDFEDDEDFDDDLDDDFDDDDEDFEDDYDDE